MDPFLFVLQVVLPIGLLAWLWHWPAAGGLPLAVHVIATGLSLLAIALVAPFAMPPYWVPWLYGLIFAVLSLRALLRAARGVWPAGWAASLSLVPLVALAAYAVGQIGAAIPGHRPPPGVEIVDIASPLPEGLYITENGGSRQVVNGHMHLLGGATGDDIGQAYALDIIKIRPSGLRTDGWRPRDPARYEGFGTPLLAPCDGRVLSVTDTAEDMEVPLSDPAGPDGNALRLDCGTFDVVLAHLRRGSALVAAGEDVAVGTPLAQMGNSGNTTEPHLHIHAERGGAPLALTIEGRFLARNDRLRVAD